MRAYLQSRDNYPNLSQKSGETENPAAQTGLSLSIEHTARVPLRGPSSSTANTDCQRPSTSSPFSTSRVAKAVLISAVPPLMVQTDANPGGLPKSVFDDLQAQLAANRSEFYRALPSGPFYGFNRPGVESSEAIIENWWRQGMMGGAKAHYDGIVAFSQTDFTEDLKKITVPALVMHGAARLVASTTTCGHSASSRATVRSARTGRKLATP